MPSTATERLMFPILCFSGGMIFPTETEEQLTTCSKAALARGYFRNLEIIDSEANRFVVAAAQRADGFGSFSRLRGYNAFFNLRIRVELEFEDSRSAVAMTEIVAKTLHSLNGSQGWTSRADFDELRSDVANASSVAEIARLLLR